MKLGKGDRDWISSEIFSQLKTAVESLKPHGWQKIVYHLRQLGPLIATIALFVALVGITIGALIQSFGHLKEETQSRTHTEDRLEHKLK